jgi:ABC-2 type transport system permease protein
MMEAIVTLWLRTMTRYIRSPSRIIGSIGMPFFFLVIIGTGLNSVSVPGMQHNYLAFIAPGIIAMTVLFTSMFSGIQIIWDKQFGFLKETLVAPVSRTSIMLGHTLGGATTAVIQGFILLAISLIFGASISSVTGFFIAVGFMLLIGLTFTAMGTAFGSRMSDMQGFPLVMNFITFPLFFLSGALFPLSGAPAWLRTLSYLDPLTYGVEGIRYGLLGTSQISPLISFGAMVGFCVAIVLIGAYFFRKIRL